MAIGMSIHVGLNEVDPAHYGTPRTLVGCVNDAQAMASLARERRFTETVLLNKHATAEAVTGAIRQAGQRLRRGDTLLLTYSGHGGFVPDTNQDENDGRDETWCLYDRQMPDDELYGLWAEFGAGARIVVLSDSCYSGSVIKFGKEQSLLASAPAVAASSTRLAIPEIRALSVEESLRVFMHHADLYLDVQRRFPKGRAANVRASVLLISACQDWQLARDGLPNGVFTNALLKVWKKGRFGGTYLQLHAAIYRLTERQKQHPNYARAGVPNPDLETQPAFAI